MNVIFCPDKRGQSLKAQLSRWNVPSWLSRNRSQLAAPSGQGSHILPTSHPYWSQAPNPIGPFSSGCPSEETSSQRLRPRKMATASTLQRQGCGRGSPLLKAWAKATGGPYWGLWSTTGCRPQSITLGPPAHPLAQGWVISRPSKKRPQSASSLTFQLMTTTPPLLKHFPNNPFLTVTGGQGPLWCWSIAEQDNEWSLIDSWLLVNGAIWGTKQGWATPVA